METEPTGILQTSVPLACTIDLVVVLILFVVRVALLAGILTLVSRHEADVRRGKCIKTAAFLCIAYFLFNATPEAILSVRTFILVVLIGTFICIKAFWITLEPAFISCLLFCGLSILMGSYAERGLETLFPERITIGRLVAHRIDEGVRHTAGDETLARSKGVIPAMLRLSITPGSNGIVDALMSPMRSFQKAKTQISNISEKRAAEASIVNMLSGAGTNVGSRADEMAALQQGLSGEAASGALPAHESGTMGAGELPGYEGSPETSDSAASPLAAGLAPGAVAPAGAAGSSAVDSNAAPPTATNGSVVATASAGTAHAGAGTNSVVATNSAAAKRSLQGGEVTGLEGMSAQDRHRWEEARKLIRASAMGWSTSGAYVMINGRMLHVGSTHRVVYKGNAFTFLFRGIASQGGCKWEPVVQKDEPVTEFIAF